MKMQEQLGNLPCMHENTTSGKGRFQRKGKKEMKTLKKMLALVTACVMMLAMGATSALAAELTEGTQGAAKTITITTPSGAQATDEFTYTIYKVFDATSDGKSNAISYKIDLTNGNLTDAMKEAGFSVDGQGNVSFSGTELSADAISAIADYAKDSVGTVKITGEGKSKTVTVPDYGYYYITTTAGTAVVINSTNPSAVVTDKNAVPTIDKKITGASSYDEDGKKALAQVGTEVTYTVDITVGKGQTNYVMKDTLGTGLAYVAGSLSAKAGDKDLTATTDYTLTVEGQNITVTFPDSTTKNLAQGSKITVTYKAKVTSDALQTNPAKNSATISYGKDHAYTSTPSSAEVYNAKFTVTKHDGENKALGGAGFVIKNSEGKYYKLTPAAEATEGAAATAATVTWVDDIKDATEYTSDANGAVTAFTGLAGGTYTLVEKTVPAGYNKADDRTFTVTTTGDTTYTAANLEQTATVVNNAGSELPSTGGIGTTIFYILGAILILGAGVVLITRRRQGAE